MNLLQAPTKGMIYALYKDRVVYEQYEKEKLPSEDVLKENLLELHLFDDMKEYRYIKKRNGIVEVCVEDQMIPHDDIYTERIFTMGKTEEAVGESESCIEVVNYIIYDENDLITIPNYRLKEVKAR